MSMGKIKLISHSSQSYPEAMREQEAIRDHMLEHKAGFTLIFTEHPPTYTLGTSASEDDVLACEIDGQTMEVYHTGRGGEVTYHGPGQLVCYVVANIQAEQDLHLHIWRLEEMIIQALAVFGVKAGRDKRGIGVWVDGLKIAAAGVRCRKWVVWHGIALNIHPNLNHFRGIVPCGMQDAPVTSLEKLGIQVSRSEMEKVIAEKAEAVFFSLLKA